MLTQHTVTKIAEKNIEPAWFVERRREAFRLFETLSLPSFRYGLGVMLDSQQLKIDDINPLDSHDTCVATGDGAEILTLQQALKHYEDVLQHYLLKIVKANDKLCALHQAFFTEGVFVRVPAGTHPEHPVVITLSSSSTAHLGHVFILAEAGSTVRVVDRRHIDEHTKGYHSHMVEILAREGSKVQYTNIYHTPLGVFHFSAKDAVVERGAHVQWIECTLGNGFTKGETSTQLQGEGASSIQYGLFFGDQERHLDLQAKTFHGASHTTSRIITYGALGGKAKAVTQGLIHIQPDMIGCNGHQEQHTLLLSESAEIDPVPMLEIQNDNVQCSHASTVSDVDEEKLFYLMSRGIDKQEAYISIVEGFFDRILREVGDIKAAEDIRQQIALRLKEMM